MDFAVRETDAQIPDIVRLLYDLYDSEPERGLQSDTLQGFGCLGIKLDLGLGYLRI
ncbi:hypothetical protein MED297_06284 [Reinekea sp. MED297]|uniref:Uncharacterized protein n=1 Tax=Reinekea blandensis MED297 TaxID=314283 RepID=A4BDJ1_9GAMM|nr:hypothetical protein MED297_06284 [Reinekea sp. MED297] [Reinekea blandensis MED297]